MINEDIPVMDEVCRFNEYQATVINIFSPKIIM